MLELCWLVACFSVCLLDALVGLLVGWFRVVNVCLFGCWVLFSLGLFVSLLVRFGWGLVARLRVISVWVCLLGCVACFFVCFDLFVCFGGRLVGCLFACCFGAWLSSLLRLLILFCFCGCVFVRVACLIVLLFGFYVRVASVWVRGFFRP